MAGYHLSEIPKGVFGDPSKIIEEARELDDAFKQGIKIMMFAELADLYGAIEEFRKLHCPEVTMEDIRLMSVITKRAFENGDR